MNEEVFYLENHAYIALCDLLKVTGAAQTGGHAKILIQEGFVTRNGAVETRKTAKIVADEVIVIAEEQIKITVKAGAGSE